MKDVILVAISAINSREIATCIWIVAVFLISVVRRPGVSNSIWVIIVQIFQKPILITFSLLAANVILVCWILSKFSLWDIDQFFPTLFWYMFSGIALLMSVAKDGEEEGYFRNLFWNNFRAIAVFEFVVVAYTFSLLIELILVPVLFMLGLLLALSENKPRLAQVHSVLQWFSVVIGITLLWWSVSNIISTPDTFFSTATGRNFVLPIILSIFSIPFLYLLHCYSQMEVYFRRIDVSNCHSDTLTRYAKRRFTALFFLRPWLFKIAVRNFSARDIDDEAAIEKIIDEILARNVRIKSPPEVPIALGWSPHFATRVLKDRGLGVTDYHENNFDDGWWGQSKYIDLDQAIFPSRVTLFLDGTERVVRQIKLSATLSSDLAPDPALDAFLELSLTLSRRALAEEEEHLDPERLHQLNFNTQIGSTDIVMETEQFSTTNGYEVRFALRRDLQCD